MPGTEGASAHAEGWVGEPPQTEDEDDEPCEEPE